MFFGLTVISCLSKLISDIDVKDEISYTTLLELYSRKVMLLLQAITSACFTGVLKLIGKDILWKLTVIFSGNGIGLRVAHTSNIQD